MYVRGFFSTLFKTVISRSFHFHVSLNVLTTTTYSLQYSLAHSTTYLICYVPFFLYPRLNDVIRAHPEWLFARGTSSSRCSPISYLFFKNSRKHPVQFFSALTISLARLDTQHTKLHCSPSPILPGVAYIKSLFSHNHLFFFTMIWKVSLDGDKATESVTQKMT